MVSGIADRCPEKPNVRLVGWRSRPTSDIGSPPRRTACLALRVVSAVLPITPHTSHVISRNRIMLFGRARNDGLGLVLVLPSAISREAPSRLLPAPSPWRWSGPLVRPSAPARDACGRRQSRSACRVDPCGMAAGIADRWPEKPNVRLAAGDRARAQTLTLEALRARLAL
jgi:hypothetical protein